jgi:hypothetical protein
VVTWAVSWQARKSMRWKKHLNLVECLPFGQNRRLKPIAEDVDALVVRRGGD